MGLGFMVQSKNLGACCSAETFGQSGSTGTLCRAEPRNDDSMVLLTTVPAQASRTSLLEPLLSPLGRAEAQKTIGYALSTPDHTVRGV